MTETARLVLAVDSREVDRGQRSLDGLTDKSRRAEQETERLTRATDQLGGAYRGLRNVLAAVGIGVAIRAVVQASDTYSELRSQLRLVTESQEELNDTYEAAYKLAQDTRGGLGETINLYARLARSSEELDLTNQQLLTVTRAINQSFVVSGASAQEAASATLQLSQGMASGTLRGEELNSVLENSPRLARAIADGLGVTIGQLRELGAEGQLTGSAVTRALLSSADSINREFQDMPRTVGQSLQQLRNDLIDTFGETDVSGFNDAIDDLRGLVTDPGFQEGVVSLGTGIATLARWLGTATTEGVKFTKWLGEEFAAQIHGIAADDIPRLEGAVADQEEQMRRLTALFEGSGGISGQEQGILDRENAKLEEMERRLADAIRLREQFNQNNVGAGANTNPDQGGGDPPEPLGGGGKDKATDSIQKRVAALQLEAETLGMTARQEELYRARKEGATAAQLAAIEGSYRQIEAYEAEQKALEFSIKSRRDAAEILAEMDKERATDIDAGEQLLERYMTEEELLREHHERRLETLETARAADFENEAKWNAAIEDENKRFNDAMEGMDKARWMAQMDLAASGLSEITGLMASENRKMFEIGKAAAIAQTLVSIPSSAQKAYDAMSGIPFVGPALGAAAAAAAIAAGLGRLQAIKSANFGGGGSAGGGGGGGITGGVQSVPAAPAPVQLQGRSGGDSSDRGVNVTVSVGQLVGTGGIEELTDIITEGLQDRVKNRDIVIVDPASRNGRDLRGR